MFTHLSTKALNDFFTYCVVVWCLRDNSLIDAPKADFPEQYANASVQSWSGSAGIWSSIFASASGIANMWQQEVGFVISVAPFFARLTFWRFFSEFHGQSRQKNCLTLGFGKDLPVQTPAPKTIGLSMVIQGLGSGLDSRN